MTGLIDSVSSWAAPEIDALVAPKTMTQAQLSLFITQLRAQINDHLSAASYTVADLYQLQQQAGVARSNRVPPTTRRALLEQLVADHIAGTLGENILSRVAGVDT